MKLSEFEAARQEHWKERWEARLGRGFAPGNWLAVGVAGDRGAAEAAGVVWDPEEEPLPGRECSGIRISERTIWPTGKVTMLVGSRKAMEREAVRRYNAWPKLEKMCREMGPGLGLCGDCEIYYRRQLEAILRGEK